MNGLGVKDRRELWVSLKNLWLSEAQKHNQGSVRHTAALKFYLTADRQLRLLAGLEAALSWSDKPFYAMRAKSLTRAILGVFE